MGARARQLPSRSKGFVSFIRRATSGKGGRQKRGVGSHNRPGVRFRAGAEMEANQLPLVGQENPAGEEGGEVSDWRSSSQPKITLPYHVSTKRRRLTLHDVRLVLMT